MSTALAVVIHPYPPVAGTPVDGAPATPRVALDADWSRTPRGGWTEFRVRRALFLASLTLDAQRTRIARHGAGPRLVEDDAGAR